MNRFCWVGAYALVVICAVQIARGDELSLSAVVPGAKWEVAVEGLGFADGLTCDREGNLYFSDLRAKPATIWKLAADGTKTKVAEGQSRSGLRRSEEHTS